MSAEHSIHFRPAFDDMVNGCAHEPKGDHGRSSVIMTFRAKLPGRGAELEISTNWHLPETYEQGKTIYGSSIDWGSKTSHASVIFLHSSSPVFEEQPPANDECKVTGGLCYSDAAYLAADDLFETLIRHGEEKFWTELDGWIPDD